MICQRNYEIIEQRLASSLEIYNLNLFNIKFFKEGE